MSAGGTTTVLVQARGEKGKRLAPGLKRQATAFLEVLRVRDAELSIAVVGDGAIRRLNREWRGKDKATDVLSFPAGELPPGVPGQRPLGDVILSVDTAQRAAKRHGVTVREELALYLAHGLLHLLGHDHERGEREARKMARLEGKLLEAVGLGGRPGLIRRTHEG